MAIGDLFSGLARLSPYILQGMTSGAANYQAQLAAQKQRQVLDAFRGQQLQFQKDQLAQQQAHQDRQAAAEEFQLLYKDLSDEGRRYQLQQARLLEPFARQAEDAATRAGYHGFSADKFLNDYANEQVTKGIGAPAPAPLLAPPAAPQLHVPQFVPPGVPVSAAPPGFGMPPMPRPIPSLPPPAVAPPVAPPDVNQLLINALQGLQPAPAEAPLGRFRPPAKEAAEAQKRREEAATAPLKLFETAASIQKGQAETKGVLGRERRAQQEQAGKIAKTEAGARALNAQAVLYGGEPARRQQRIDIDREKAAGLLAKWRRDGDIAQMTSEWRKNVSQTANSIRQGMLNLATAKSPDEITALRARAARDAKYAEFLSQNLPETSDARKAMLKAATTMQRIGDMTVPLDPDDLQKMYQGISSGIEALRKVNTSGTSDQSLVKPPPGAATVPSTFSSAQINAAGRALSDPGWRKQMESAMPPAGKQAFEAAIAYVKRTRGTKKGR